MLSVEMGLKELASLKVFLYHIACFLNAGSIFCNVMLFQTFKVEDAIVLALAQQRRASSARLSISGKSWITSTYSALFLCWFSEFIPFLLFSFFFFWLDFIYLACSVTLSCIFYDVFWMCTLSLLSDIKSPGDPKYMEAVGKSYFCYYTFCN